MNDNDYTMNDVEILKYGIPLIIKDLFKARSEEESLEIRKFMKSLCDKEYGIFTYVLSCLTVLKNKEQTDVLKIECAILNSFICKMLSLYELATNDRFVELKGEIKKRIDSVSGQNIIARALYELLILHHQLITRPKTEKERELVISLWRLSSINNYLEEPLFGSNIIQNKQEAEEAKKELIVKIKANPYYADKNISLINKRIKEKSVKYLVFNDNGILMPTSITKMWNVLYEDGIFKNKDSEMLYNRLSTEHHSTYLGLFFEERIVTEERDLRLLPFYLGCSLLALMIDSVLRRHQDIAKLLYARYNLEDLECHKVFCDQL